MKGKFVVIGKNGDRYYYRTLGHAFNRFWKIYCNDDITVSLINRCLISLEV